MSVTMTPAPLSHPAMRAQARPRQFLAFRSASRGLGPQVSTSTGIPFLVLTLSSEARSSNSTASTGADLSAVTARTLSPDRRRRQRPTPCRADLRGCGNRCARKAACLRTDHQMGQNIDRIVEIDQGVDGIAGGVLERYLRFMRATTSASDRAVLAMAVRPSSSATCDARKFDTLFASDVSSLARRPA